MTLGERILQLRTGLGMTQKELAGDVITRNMLSQIEHDSAHPSMKTLSYLAEKLGVSVGTLLGQEQSGGDLDGARKKLASGDYAGALRLAEGRGAKEERNLLISTASAKLAQEAYREGKIGQAREYAKNALDKNTKTIYFSRETEFSALGILLLCDFAENTKCKESFTSFKASYEGAAWEGRYHLLQAFRHLQEEHLQAAEREIWTITVLTDHDKPYYLFLRGLIALRQEKTSGAVSFLKQAEELHPKDVLLLEQIYTCLETASKDLEDYKDAYHYAALVRELKRTKVTAK